jgi:SAM-dependent methyltransferase
MSVPAGTAREFYHAQYQGERYAAPAPAGHSFRDRLANMIVQYGNSQGKWLEVGSGRGGLQDVVGDYTAVDIAASAAAYMHKPFVCAPAEELPFPDGVFDGAWSYAVLEHVDDPERALSEMRRVLKSGGILILAPAWQCRPWAGQDYAWKPYAELGVMDRVRKALISLRNSVGFRLLTIAPRRVWRLWVYAVLRGPMRFRTRRLEPNYGEYRMVDADARHSMDPFEAILWFRSRGDRVCSHPGWRRALAVRTGALVVEVRKP